MATTKTLPPPEYGYFPILSLTSGGATIVKYIKREEEIKKVYIMLHHDITLLPKVITPT